MLEADEENPGWRSGGGAVVSATRRFAFAIVAPAAIGVVTGCAVAALSVGFEDKALVELANLPGGLPALGSLVALPLAVAVAIYVTRTLKPSTSELFIHAYHTPGARIPIAQVPGRVLAAIATVGLGGSQGFESPSALIGSSVGELISRVRSFSLRAEEHLTLVVAGASAGIAAVFSSPSVGALYGIEVPFRRDVDAPRLVPAAVAAGASYGTHTYLAGHRALVEMTVQPEINELFVIGVLAVAVGCGIGARLFASACEGLRSLARHGTPWLRAAAGGVVLASLAWAGYALTGTWITFGPGYIAAEWISSGQHALPLLFVAMLVRTAGTLTCVYGGGGGGVFTSLACTGVFVGEIIEGLFPAGHGRFLPLLGGACFLAAGYRLPVACMMLVAEQTGDPSMVVAALVAVGIAQVLMGDASVSDAQVERRAERA